MGKLKFALFTILSLLVVTSLIGFGWLRSSLPDLDGTVTLSGIDAPVTIARDSYGIPHISADSDADMFFGLGYAHAQDRLWQMEVNRRLGAGRLAEVIGEPGVGFDKYFRTLGFAVRAASAWDNLDAETRHLMQTYADGVNAYLAEHRGAWPPEFVLTGTTPEPWSPLDTLVWQKMMWLSLSGNMRHELARARLATQLTPEQIMSIYPTYPGDVEAPFPELDTLYAGTLETLMAVTGGEPEATIGSNNWVIDGSRTKSGMPLLANDPHLGLSTPSIWYLVRLHNRTKDTNLVGVGFPGSPSIILGRNDKIAWGFTNTASDVQDIFIEKLVNDGQQYLTPDGPADFVTRPELIKVSGGDDILMTVRETRHGPVMSDLADPDDNDNEFLRDGHVLALQWTALMDEDPAVKGILALTRSDNFDAFKAAGTLYYGPEQNMVYADTDGNIGYYAPALVPVRRPDNEIMGRLPSPGWLAKYDWQGFLPFEDLPTRFNPDGGMIATANEKIVGDDYPHFLTRDWSLPYRGNRIRAELDAVEKHDVESFAALHYDTTSDMARELVAALLPHLDKESAGYRYLSEWQGQMDKNRAEPLIFHTWMRHYQEALMADELGDLYDDFRRLRPRLISSTLRHAATADGTTGDADTPYYTMPTIGKDAAMAWCDNITTNDVTESCADLAVQAMETTFEDLTEKHGTEAYLWKWGDEHILTQSHRPFSQIPVIKDYFELTAPASGSVHTINVSGVSQNENSRHASGFGASYRGIFDMDDLEKSIYVQPTGQSGNPFSRHFDDLFPLWLKGEYVTIPTTEAVPADAAHILRLEPAQ